MLQYAVILQYDIMQYYMIYSMIQCNVMRYGATGYDEVWFDVIQYNAAHYDTVQ